MALRTNASGEVVARTAALPSPTAFTICSWANLAQRLGQWQYLFFLEDAAVTPTAYLGMGYRADDDTLEITNSIGGQVSFGSKPTDATWFFWALACSGTGGGSLVGYWRSPTGSFVTASSVGASFTPARLALLNNGYDEWVDGRLAGVRVWDAALTQAELELEMWSLRAVRRANLHIESPFVEGVLADNDKDFSGNGKDWTRTGTLAVEKGPPVPWGPSRRRKISYVPGTVTVPPIITTRRPWALPMHGRRLPMRNAVPLFRPMPPVIALPSGTTFFSAVDGAISPTGALTKTAGKQVAGTEAPSGSLTRQVQRLLAGAISPAAALVRQTQRVLTAAIGPAGALVKQVSRLLTGSISPSGTLTAIKTILITLTASISPSGTISRQAQKALSAAIAATGALQKHLTQRLTGSLGSSGALSRAVSRILSGALGLTGSVVSGILGAAEYLVLSYVRDATPPVIARDITPEVTATDITPDAVTRDMS